ncbi:NAD(P)/FAD-dependent oxidoreductase [Natrarchaeobaculum aegyptiacum]|uniref:NAD/FAD-dependent oxidoreductase n=1 Tax=Natrarchaeobaculum aegyptiacum TaxID=745377 RepID=A0A2Z2HUJ3_9EURY|nr:FAD-dependent oxidoreductase [Natrarchaeobaculum aegyptiacum]ARS90852.1 NAD/FAD-dependent oxidoreductase [Natrarchaeobaculum aegyptiacum]
MQRICVVGAGAAGAAATHVLSERTDAAVTVLEKSGGVCGRAATRRRDETVYDYGANYVTDDDRVATLLTESLEADGLVEIAEPTWTLDADGTVSPGRKPSGRRWTYRRGLTQIAKRLFERAGATVHRRTRVERLEFGGEPGDSGRSNDGRWHLTDAGGDRWGPFDAVLLTPPAPQTAALLRATDWDAEARDGLVEAVGSVPYRQVFTGVFHYPFALDEPYYALINPEKDHEIGWIGREECKPGHVPEGESLLVVQANHEWSVAREDDDPEASLAELARLTAEVVGDDRLTDPDWTDHQHWRYALPEAKLGSAPLDQAETAGLFVAGDWVAGEGRVAAALRNGLEVGERMAERSE